MIEYKIFYRDKWNKFIEERVMDGLKMEHDYKFPLLSPDGDGYRITTAGLEKLADELIKHSNIKQYIEEKRNYYMGNDEFIEFLMTLIFDSCVGVFFTHAE